MKLRSSVGSDVKHRMRRTNQLNQKAYFRDAVTDRDVLKNCSLAVNRQHLHKQEKFTVLYNKLQYIVLQSCYKSTIKCESNVEYNLTS